MPQQGDGFPWGDRAEGPRLDAPEWTLVDVVREAAREHGERPAFLHPDGRTRASWSDVLAWTRRVGRGLVALGLRPGDRVAVVSDTRAEWVVADQAVLMAGGVTVTCFPTLPAPMLAEVLSRSDVRFAFVEGQDVLDKLEAAVALGARVERWVAFDPVRAASEEAAKRALSLADLETLGERAEEGELDRRIARLRPDDVATIVYTSGTTGTPKGVVLTHRNLVSNSWGAIRHLKLGKHPVGLAFLPLAHSYQRQTGVVCAMLAGAVAFSSPRRLQEDLPRVRPTIFPAVPRLYERLYERIQATARRQPPLRRAVFRWAEATARAYGHLALRRRPLPAPLRWRHAAFERLVYRRIRRMAGLDRLDLAITGAAAVREDLLDFFWGIGVRIVEGWGLTETAAPATVNPPDAPRPGTVGTPLPGVEIAIAADGEVLVRGPNVFAGYDGLPAETDEALLFREGSWWLCTGDVGALDADGYLRIVDRKKELEVLDTGKKVAPLPIEERLKASPFVAEAVLVAHGRKYPGCLLQPDYEALLRWAREAGVPFDEARTRAGPTPTGETGIVEVDPALLADPRVQARFDREVARVNEALPPHEQVKRHRLLASALSAERGEVTPTLKKRRRVILEERRADVDALFAP